VALPALVTVSSELGKPRIPSGWGIISAAKKQIPSLTLQEIGIDSASAEKLAPRNRLLKLSAPSLGRSCELVKGEVPADVAEKLVQKILEKKVL
ncbi:MAG TPA: hypothetical protein VLS90_10470, partial [Thermodesulfobacteriota bacterium]|nr:hypothetical protein [Thermodesulfobacteriota bacterium]